MEDVADIRELLLIYLIPVLGMLISDPVKISPDMIYGGRLS